MKWNKSNEKLNQDDIAINGQQIASIMDFRIAILKEKLENVRKERLRQAEQEITELKEKLKEKNETNH